MSHDYTTLMSRRVRRILLICNNYDSYTLEEDGHVETQLASDYAELNLSNPPSITRTETTAQALEILREGERFDLVLTMYNVGAPDAFTFAKESKSLSPGTPVVLLCGYAREIFRRIAASDLSGIDDVFCWNGSTDLLIAIIKLYEDSWNADHDILECNVQAILLVEDSVRYYSTYLPMLYRMVLEQNSNSLHDALNEAQLLLRKRSRPKILMAKCYDDAVELYEKYKRSLLGVITDVGFVLHRGDPPEKEKLNAGVNLAEHILSDDEKMPILMQSSQQALRSTAESLGVGFVLKSSNTLTYEIEDYIGKKFGFGDFIATDISTGEEIGRASNLREFEHLIAELPDENFKAFADDNYLSKWLYARGLPQIGQVVRSFRTADFPDIEQNRRTVVNLIHEYRIKEGLGAVARFDPDNYDSSIRFAYYGSGSMGGKARGLAFLNHMLQKYDLYDAFKGARLLVPRTFALMTDCFERFIVDNGLKYVIKSDLTDEEILSEFVSSTLPEDVTKALRAFISMSTGPLAVRSSSSLEDSYYQPFAGVYSTYMVPRTEDPDQQLRLVSKAVKSVYASIYFASARRYITSAGNLISEEKMGIVLQEVCGRREGEVYLPSLSGVARSVNFYPLEGERSEDGVAKIVYGLGKAVVDGDKALRFSPARPDRAIQFTSADALQECVYALSLQSEKFTTSTRDDVNLLKLSVEDCVHFRSFAKVCSTFDTRDWKVVDNFYAEGPKLISFASVLKYDSFPLAKILSRLLEIAKSEMKCDVEIEFAADLEASPAIFNVLQIRPISRDALSAEVDWSGIDETGAFLRSACALGTGWIEGVRDIVYLKPSAFDKMHTAEMIPEIAAINAALEGRGYLLIGFGRWGTSIPTLGVGVKWSDISGARCIVECSLEDFRVDPSQGTHFFQNMTSFNAGYVSVDPYLRSGSDSLDFTLLDSLPAEREGKYFRCISLRESLRLCVDGKRGRAMAALQTNGAV